MTPDTSTPTRRILHRWSGTVLWEGPAATPVADEAVAAALVE